MSSNKTIKYAFFGTGPLAESVLASLVRNNYTPELIVTKPDSLQGRHMQLTAPYIKTWGEMKGITVLQPEKLDDVFYSKLQTTTYDVFIVASYGKMIPERILTIPKKGTLNVHPSLLPHYRGPSPIESCLLEGNTTTGVTIIQLDNEMDHGPILTQNAFSIPDQITAGALEVMCGQMGGELLCQSLENYIDGSLIPTEQDHTKATFCKKIIKDLGEITLEMPAVDVRNKFRALTPWPSLYFFYNHHNKIIRVKVTGIDLTTQLTENTTAQDIIISVIPEGKKEIDWQSFVHGYIHS